MYIKKLVFFIKINESVKFNLARPQKRHSTRLQTNKKVNILIFYVSSFTYHVYLSLHIDSYHSPLGHNGRKRYKRI
jgi:hypothetical protein